MSEFELIQIAEAAIGQIIVLMGQLIAITFAMVVAIFYFLNTARLGLKLAGFALYVIGSLTFLLMAVRESVIVVGATAALEAIEEDARSPVTAALLEFNGTAVSVVMNVFINTSIWALWVVVIYLLFFWKKDRHPAAA